MTKSELKAEIRERLITLTPRQIDPVVDAVFDVIREELEDGNRVAIDSFGAFETRIRKAPCKFDPKTGDPIDMGELRSVKFKPSPVLNKAIDESWDGEHGKS